MATPHRIVAQAADGFLMQSMRAHALEGRQVLGEKEVGPRVQVRPPQQALVREQVSPSWAQVGPGGACWHLPARHVCDAAQHLSPRAQAAPEALHLQAAGSGEVR